MRESVSGKKLDGRPSTKQCDRVVAGLGGSYRPISSNPEEVRVDCVCKEGHLFRGTFRTILSGEWCRECRADDEWAEFAARLGWKVRSTVTTEGRVFRKVLCGQGHEVPVTDYKVRKQKAVICVKCKKDTFFRERDRVCHEHGGVCLDEGFRGESTRLTWRCAEGHTFRAKLSEVVEDNSWCVRCRLFQDHGGEFLNEGFGTDVSEIAAELGWTVRLRGRPKGTFDILCDKGHKVLLSKYKLKHTLNPKCRVCEYETYLERRERVCKEYGGECLDEGYKSASTKLKWRCAEGHSFSARMRDVVEKGKWCSKCEYYQEMVELAQSKGWSLLSKKFINKGTIYRWSCPSGHVVRKMAQRAFSCEVCGDGSERLRLARVRQIAEEKSGACLSTNCPGDGKNLRMECSKGHKWITSFSSLVYGDSWCPECSKTRTSLKDARKVAAARGGKCWSTDCHDRKSVLDWECAEGHRFSQQYIVAREKSGWCAECKKAGKRFETVTANRGYRKGCMKSPETMMKRVQTKASDKGGVCLSTEYKNLGTKMKFECAKGHSWEASPRNVLYRGSWCPCCANVRMTLADLKERTRSSGARITTETYLGSTAIYDWICDHGHVFSRSVDGVRKGGCPTCKKEKKLKPKRTGISKEERPLGVQSQ